MKVRRPIQVTFLLLLLFRVVTTTKHAESQEPVNTLTLEQALNRARLNAPALLAAKARIEEARGRLRGASIALQTNPVLEGTLGPRMSDLGRSRSADVSISQDFEALGRRTARIDGAQAGVSLEIAVSQETGRQLLRDVAAGFMRALAAGEKLKVLADADQVASDFLTTAQRRYQAGDVAILDVNLARNGAARTHAELRSGRAELTTALGDLHVLLGIPPDEQFTTVGRLKDLQTPDLNSLLKTAQDRPDIRVLEGELREAESEVRLGNTFKSPDFGLIGRYQRDQGDNVAEAGVRLSIPVFSRGQELRATGSARATRIRNELRASRTGILNEIRAAFDAYTLRAQAAQELETNALPSLTENETLARRSYEEGEIGFPELLLIRREILETRLAYLNALLDAALAGVDLQFKAGVLQ